LNKPEKTKVRGPGRTTRTDWINAAKRTLIDEGVDQVKVLSLSTQLNCARSSFYWYFKNRGDLLDGLLKQWAETNTPTIVKAAQRRAPTINSAIAYLHIEWLIGNEFDNTLDLAIREWSRRSAKVRSAVSASDSYRIRAITQMFNRFDFSPAESETRAQIVYFVQIGYSSTQQHSGPEGKLVRSRRFLHYLTGIQPTDEEVKLLARSLASEK